MPVKRGWFQIHLLTAIVLMFAAGGLLKANLGEPKQYVVIDLPTLRVQKTNAKPPMSSEIRIFRIAWSSVLDARNQIDAVFKLEPPNDPLMSQSVVLRANAMVIRALPETLDAAQSIVEYYDKNPPNALINTYRSMGWPFSMDTFSIQAPALGTSYSTRTADIRWSMVSVDAAIAFAILIAVAFICEMLVRRRSFQNTPCVTTLSGIDSFSFNSTARQADVS